METREELGSGASLMGAEAHTQYQMAPRTEDPSQISGQPAMSVTPASLGSMGNMTEKKRRGRPRKYGPDGTVAKALSPTPISSSAPSGGKVWMSNYEKKKFKKMGMDHLGDWSASSLGSNFTPHVITVHAGEDVTLKIISFSQQGPRAICILSANGVVSNVTLSQADSSGGTLTYEGRFEILSLSGSFMPTESRGAIGRSGGMSVSLAGPDGRVVGGSVAGLLVAASPVQVVVGSFLPGNSQHEQRIKKAPKSSDPIPSFLNPAPTNISPIPVSNPDGEREDITGGHMQQNPSPFQRDSWADINISLPEG